MITAATVVPLTALVGLVLPVSLYLAALVVAAPFGLRRHLPSAGPARSFAILVPAHDEERVLGRLLRSLRGLEYPAERYDVWVVADNCSDRTAQIARMGGALVCERLDPGRKAKGYALAWLLDQIKARAHEYDAYVVVDADSMLSPNFLRVMNDYLEAGAKVVQAYYGVLVTTGSRAEALRQASFALVHYLRPAAKMAVGASCGIKGNGVCFGRAVIEHFGWPAAGLAEDVEFHLALVREGLRVEFASEARVVAEMPPSLRQAETQNHRWEAGRLHAARRQALPLLLRGMRRHNVAQIDAAFEQLVPPLSVTMLVGSVIFGMGIVLRSPLVWFPSACMLSVMALYVVAGLTLARLGPRVWLALLDAPRYVIWKSALYLRALLNPATDVWTRTPHGVGGAGSSSGRPGGER